MNTDVQLSIHYSRDNLTVFSINLDYYFFQLLPVPKLFDDNLVPQIIPNLDSWFQAKTQLRYSYQNFLDMIIAFTDGYVHAYTHQDLEKICVEASLLAKRYILAERMGEYSKHYWVEVIDPAKVEKYVQGIREKFDNLKTKTNFYNYLCRFWKFTKRNCPQLTPVFEKFITRLDRVAQDPVYPRTDDLDSELLKFVIAKVLPTVSMPKGLPERIVDKLPKREKYA